MANRSANLDIPNLCNLKQLVTEDDDPVLLTA